MQLAIRSFDLETRNVTESLRVTGKRKILCLSYGKIRGKSQKMENKLFKLWKTGKGLTAIKASKFVEKAVD